MTGNIKPHYFASRSFDVVIVGDDDGLDARAKALQSPDDVGHIQCLVYNTRSHDALGCCDDDASQGDVPYRVGCSWYSPSPLFFWDTLTMTP